MKSKIPSGGKPLFSTIPLITRLEDVPNRSSMPPSKDPYTIGSRSRDATRLVRRAISMVTGRNMAATPILFIKAERMAALVISTLNKRFSVWPATRMTWLPKKEATPVRARPEEIINIAQIATTAGLEKPVKASAGVTRPKTTSNTSTIKATRSGRRISLMKKMMAISKMPKVRAISRDNQVPSGQVG